jgi:membrane fusion protein, multidrug efflux system
MRIIGRIFVILLVGAIALAAGYAILGPGGQQKQRGGARGGNPDAPIPVKAMVARVADVPVYLVGVGTVRALNMVLVRTLVNGTVLKINFQEGQDVKKGDVLALIDPRIYKAQFDQAVAKKALDEAQLANARRDLVRYENLVKTNAVTKQQYDTQKALVDQFVAQVALDQGAIDNAKAYLDWCTIVAPLDGRLGIRLVDEGNIVNTTDASGIVVLTQIRPISLLFNLPQQVLGKINAAFAEGSLPVDAMDSDNQTMLDHGKLTVVNNQVDQTTGTVQLKAEFPNAKLQLWPGEFVNVRLLINTLPNVVVVPTAAVQRGPNNMTFVYVVQPDETVAVRQVSVTQQGDTETVLASGVQPAERVVVSGFVQLADGRKVTVANAESTPQPAQIDERAISPPAGNEKGRDGGGERRGGRRGKTSATAPSARP